ncbi:hypothetical protein DPMN_181114 [Dreissena polymorpha]|uniref:Sodefrin-like factor n=1 Tax=Dreissena polymorpha TaxID=45954 RepID=A0A9D4DCW9_DREPO|nr:hypothetical protein DPMN_181114 [Dreissena polymorpha]
MSKEMAKTIALSVVVSFMLFKTTIALGCFECVDSPHPADCNQVTVCTDYETCVVKQYVTTGGLILYSSGCETKSTCTSFGKRNIDDVIHERQSRQQSSDVITCAECCNGSYCNMVGCGITKVSQPARGPMCYACKTSDSPDACRTVTECEQGMACKLTQIPGSLPGTHEYESGCMKELVCRLQMGQAHHSPGFCSVCCTDDFCNNSCASNSTMNGK